MASISEKEKKELMDRVSKKVDKDTQEDAEILASQIMSQGNVQV